MRWKYWVLNNFAGTNSVPKEWYDILEIVDKNKLVDNKVLNKIEVAAFSTRGNRQLRWTIDESDPQYATEKTSLDIAKKLLANYLQLVDLNITIPENLKILLSDYLTNETTKCSLCKEEITSKMFLLDGRKDQDAINMGHIEPLNTRDQTKSNHYPENVCWQHRRCNYMQGERNIETALNYMYEILKRHSKIK